MKKITNLLFNDFVNDNRVLKESSSLVNAGYEVELVATKFDANLPSEENLRGIKIVRHSVGWIKFLPLNLFLFWIKIIFKYKREKIFHCNDLYTLPPAYFIKKFINKKIKIVYDCHEHETEAGIYVGKPILKYFAKKIEKKMIPFSDAVITVSESIAEDYVKMYGIEKPYLILNTPNYKEYKNKDLFRKKLGISKDKQIFLFQGEYGLGRGIDKLIRIFTELYKKNPSLVLVLLVYGEGIEKLKGEVEGIDNIFWHPKVSPLEYMEYVASADWGIYLMENICKNHDYALPNKVFDYVFGGLPVVVSNLKEMSQLVTKNHIGYAINPEDENEVIELLQGIALQAKKKFASNLRLAAKKYSWEKQEKILIKIYQYL